MEITRSALSGVLVLKPRVFDGATHGAYAEDDTPNPLNVYGRTKLASEHA